MTLFNDVGEFHAKFSLDRYGDGSVPALIQDHDLLEFRIKFLREELDEFIDACRAGDLPGAADGLADLVWVALGTAHMMHLPFDEIWAEIRRANMQKERANGSDDPRSKRAHACDVVKPEGWQPPDIAAVLLNGRLNLRSWDDRFMDLAEHVAGWSKDPSSKVGAVLVGRDRRRVAHGYNGFPPGIMDLPERLMNREMKYKLIQHAERNVLDNAQFDVRGGTLYSTRYPCSECTKSIISKYIERVVTRLPPEYEPWRSDVKWSSMMMAEAGVVVEYR